VTLFGMERCDSLVPRRSAAPQRSLEERVVGAIREDVPEVEGASSRAW